MTGITLTLQQQTLLDIIKAHIANHNRAPSCQLMADAMGFNSKSNIHRLLLALEERGAIRRLPSRHRAIQVVDSATEAERNAGIALAAIDRAARMGNALLVSRAFLTALRDELLNDFCAANSNLDRNTMDASEAAYVDEIEAIIAQINEALPDGAQHG